MVVTLLPELASPYPCGAQRFCGSILRKAQTGKPFDPSMQHSKHQTCCTPRQARTRAAPGAPLAPRTPCQAQRADSSGRQAGCFRQVARFDKQHKNIIAQCP